MNNYIIYLKSGYTNQKITLVNSRASDNSSEISESLNAILFV